MCSGTSLLLTTLRSSGAASFRPFILLGILVFPRSPGVTVVIRQGLCQTRLRVNAQLRSQSLVGFEVMWKYLPLRLSSR